MVDSWVEIDAIVATTHRVEKYGAVRLGEKVLQQIAGALNSGAFPMVAQHDWTQPIRTRDMRADVVQLPDGEHGVHLVGFIHPEDWAAVGEMRSMSFTAGFPIGRADGPHPDAEPVRLSADAAWFDDATIAKACSTMCAVAPAEGSRLYQFSALDDLRIIVEMGLNLVIALGPDLAASAIWDGIKLMLSAAVAKRAENGSSATARIELVTPLPTGEVVGIIDTNDRKIAKAGLAAYSRAIKDAARAARPRRSVLTWMPTAAGGQWSPVPAEDPKLDPGEGRPESR